MIFVIGVDDKGDVLVKTTSSVGRSDQLIFLLEEVPPQIREIARIVAKWAGTIGYISWNVPYQDAVEKYTDLLSMPSESFNDFAKSMERLVVNNLKIEGTQRETHYKRKISSRTKIQTWQQPKNTLKYKAYELRIYNKDGNAFIWFSRLLIGVFLIVLT